MLCFPCASIYSMGNSTLSWNNALYYASPVREAEEEEVIDRVAAARHRLQHLIGQHATQHRTHLRTKRVCQLHFACCSCLIV